MASIRGDYTRDRRIGLYKFAVHTVDKTYNRPERSPPMIKIKPLPKNTVDPKQAGETASTKQIAKNAVHGGPKDVKKDKRSGAGRGQKG
jgi:hypothetical protein